MRAITLAEANKIIAGTLASARKRKAHALAAIVLDAGGRVKAFQKQDGASLLRFEIAYGKAFAALALNRSSRQVLRKANEKPAFMESLAELSDGPLFLEAAAASSSAMVRAKSSAPSASLATSTKSTISAPSTGSEPLASVPTPTSIPSRQSGSTSSWIRRSRIPDQAKSGKVCSF